MIECDELRYECDDQSETFRINRDQNRSPHQSEGVF